MILNISLSHFSFILVNMMVSFGFRYAVSCSRLFTSSLKSRLLKNLGSGRKLITGSGLFGFPIVGSRPFSSLHNRNSLFHNCHGG